MCLNSSITFFMGKCTATNFLLFVYDFGFIISLLSGTQIYVMPENMKPEEHVSPNK